MSAAPGTGWGPSTGERPPAAPRVAVYLDQAYWRAHGVIVAERSFVLFLNHVAAHFDEFTVIGRLSGDAPRGDYALAPSIRFVALPEYRRGGAEALGVARVLPGSLARVARVLGDVDVLWLFGPGPLALAIAATAVARRTPMVLGVRQHLPAYARSRHPQRRAVHLAADAMEAGFRTLARRRPVVVVGPDLARRYRRARSLLAVTVSLLSEADIVPNPTGAHPDGDGAPRRYDGELEILVVSRLDREKNPLLLADAFSRLTPRERWRMVICGDGPMRAALQDRLGQLGIADRVTLRGHVPLRDGLLTLYRSAHVLLHVSWTEGLPQVLFEAFAAGLPVVATDVGGVAEAAGDAVLLIGPGDADAAAEALTRIAAEDALRERLVAQGLRLARRHTVEHEAAATAAFLAAAAPRPAPRAAAGLRASARR